MINKIFKSFIEIILYSIFFISIANADIVKKINVEGNQRVSKETIKTFSLLKLNDELNDNKINDALKSIYESDFFKNVKIKFNDNIVTIIVEENPIIENLKIDGIKANRIREDIFNTITLKSRGSYLKKNLVSDIQKIKNLVKNLGYYFVEVEGIEEILDDNKVNITFKINLGDKAKIKKISFIGNKIFKDNKLKRVIVSEEYKFWKFISGKKFLNENINKLDLRLLKNYYLNKGYYNAEINSSFAKMISNNEFELVFNIDAKNKIYFGDLSLDLPIEFDETNFKSLNNLFLKIKGSPYSINTIQEILNEIDVITINEQYESIKAEVVESVSENKINLVFKINETDRVIVERINIFGNNITNENVIRNQLLIDEGDPYNEILSKKSINNIKSLNFFKKVESNVVKGSNPDSRVINIEVDEKATGEISAGAGFGTSGGTVIFGVKENNYLGKGLSVNSSFTLNSESLKGILSIRNPNYNNTDKSAFASIESLETDRLTKSGYKMNKTGVNLGTEFEYYDDFYLGFSTSTFFEKIETNSTASARQRSQEGNYFDTFINLNMDLDKRNQKFQTDKGFRSYYDLKVPILSDTNTLTNLYTYKFFTDLYENNISTFSVYLKSVNSISNDDIKLSERAFIPSNRLRGFESGKVGPKDGDDFVGGNYIATLNFSSTLPFLLENSQNTDFLMFLDVANIWGVDYNSSIDDGEKIRSAIGIAVDWFTPIGPLNFSLSEVISKKDTDVTEGFRFNLGTTF